MMNFQMEVKTVTILNSIPTKFVDVASWNANLMNPLNVNDAGNMVKHSAVTVYRIVTVVVS
jgi:hypothetical protein